MNRRALLGALPGVVASAGCLRLQEGSTETANPASSAGSEGTPSSAGTRGGESPSTGTDGGLPRRVTVDWTEDLPVKNYARVGDELYLTVASDEDGSLVRFDLDDETSTQVYDFAINSIDFLPPKFHVTVSGRTAYCTGRHPTDGKATIVAVDIDSGTKKWSFQGAYETPTTRPAVVGDRVAFCSATIDAKTDVEGTQNRGEVYVLDRESGDLDWNVDQSAMNENIYPDGLVLTDSRLVVCADDTHVFDLDSREHVERIQPALNKSPAYVDGLVYATSGRTSKFVCYDLANGRIRWRAEMFAEQNGSPLVTQDYVVVGTDRGVAVYDRNEQVKKWFKPTIGPVYARPTVFRNAAWAVIDGTVHGFSLADGSKQFEVDVSGDAAAGHTFAYDGALYAASEGGLAKLVVADQTTGDADA